MEKRNQNIDIDLITRHLSGESNASEEKELKRWLAADPENSRLLNNTGRFGKSLAGLNLWPELTSTQSGISLNPGWKRVEK